MPNVSFTRPELAIMARRYSRIADCLLGSTKVKSKQELYLPAPEPTNTDEGKKRYEDYITRAVFYNVTRRTQRGFLGQMFSRLPAVEVPTELAPLVADMNGSGVNAVQQCKSTAGEVLAMGRAGLLSDFPSFKEGEIVTRAQLLTGEVKPSITFYGARQIINWRHYQDRTERHLMYVILEEQREIYKPGEYSFTVAKQWRVCRLDDSGYYVQELYYDNKSEPVLRSFPVDASGNRLDYIPFEFIGSEDNDPDLDEPPLFDIADLNLAHYVNSADFEDSAWLVGQPTVVVTGLTTAWVNEVFQGQALRMGSRNVIPLPVGGTLDIKQADGNSLAQAGMEQKERQMVALGAKLVEQKQVQRTATEANQDESAEASTLMNVADNTSVAYAQAFASAMRYVSTNEGKITFKINTAFEIAQLDAQGQQALILMWQKGALAWPEMRDKLRRSGFATMDDDKAKKLIDEEEQERAERLEDAMIDPKESGATGATGATGDED